MKRTHAARAFAGLALAVVVACSGGPQAPTSPSAPPSPPTTGTPPADPPPAQPPSPPPSTPPFTPSGRTSNIVVVGDIGMCTERESVERTAKLVDNFPGELLLAGDLAYMHGSLQNFRECFEPAWGKFKSRWRPVPGNHEYETNFATGYRQFFGDAAGQFGRTFYSFRSGDWLVLMIDSNVGVREGSEQYEFVRNALLTNAAPCTLAVWHHPLFTSGPNGPQPFMRDMWKLLYDGHADVVVAAHDHLYERFGKQDADGRSDARGVRQFIAGTGGARLYDFQRQEVNSQARHRVHGVLRLTLNPTSYAWAFVSVDGATLDSGTDGCH